MSRRTQNLGLNRPIVLEALEGRLLLSVSASIEGIPAKAVEGTAIELAAKLSDPLPGATYAWEVSKNGSPFATGSGSKFVFTPDDNGAYLVRLTASGKGDSASASREIAVQNVAPQLAIVGPDSAIAGTPCKITLSASDPGTDTISSFMINWGDGTGQTTTASPGSLAHTYAKPGKYFIAVTATDEDGSYYVAGPQFSVADASSGLNAGKGIIWGVIFDDADGNGIKSKSEPGLAKRRVFLDLNRNGMRDVDEPTTVSNVAGRYSFSSVSAGDYELVTLVTKGWRASRPAISPLAVADGGLTMCNVGLTRTSRIGGNVFIDENGNGVQDAGEISAFRARVFLDSDGDGRLDPGEKTARTGAQGAFLFNGLPAGQYQVRLVSRSVRVTSPESGFYRVKLTPASTRWSLRFGFQS